MGTQNSVSRSAILLSFILMTFATVLDIAGVWIIVTTNGKSIDSGGGAGFIGIILLLLGMPLLFAPIAWFVARKQSLRTRWALVLAILGITVPIFSWLFGIIALVVAYSNPPGEQNSKYLTAVKILGFLDLAVLGSLLFIRIR